MAKTAKEIQGDMVALLKGSAIARLINGKVYRSGYRPRDSRKEDAVVIYTAGIPSQVQTGVITIHVYVPDVTLNGVQVEDGKRTAVIERALQDWADSLTCGVSNYRFSLQQTVTTIADDEIQQHIVVAMLRYELFDEN